jgi:hypothetical protein
MEKKHEGEERSSMSGEDAINHAASIVSRIHSVLLGRNRRAKLDGRSWFSGRKIVFFRRPRAVTSVTERA